MAKYQRRPDVFEAIQFIGTNLAECSTFIENPEITHDEAGDPPQWMSLATPGRYSAVCQGDWIIRHPDGRFDVMTPEEFEGTYRPIGGGENG